MSLNVLVPDFPDEIYGWAKTSSGLSYGKLSGVKLDSGLVLSTGMAYDYKEPCFVTPIWFPLEPLPFYLKYAGSSEVLAEWLYKTIARMETVAYRLDPQYKRSKYSFKSGFSGRDARYRGCRTLPAWSDFQLLGEAKIINGQLPLSMLLGAMRMARIPKGSPNHLAIPISGNRIEKSSHLTEITKQYDGCFECFCGPVVGDKGSETWCSLLGLKSKKWLTASEVTTLIEYCDIEIEAVRVWQEYYSPLVDCLSDLLPTISTGLALEGWLQHLELADMAIADQVNGIVNAATFRWAATTAITCSVSPAAIGRLRATFISHDESNTRKLETRIADYVY